MAHDLTASSERDVRARSGWARLLLAASLALLILAARASAATFVVNVGQGGGTVFVDQTSGNSTTTIQVGDTVQWVWQSGPHSTSSGTCTSGGYYGTCTPDGNWDAGQHSPPYSFSKTFTQTGSFNYYCSVHQSMMTGMVVVKAATGPPPATAFRFAPTGPIAGATVQFTDMSTGSPTSRAWNFGDAASGASNTSALQNPTHVFSAAGTYTVTLSATNAGGSATVSNAVTVAAGGATTCTVDIHTMCLGNGRFQVTATWSKTDGTSGPGFAVPLTSDSGYLWFFDATNIEVVAKVLGACAVNAKYWVFLAGLTNVDTQVDILDTSTGISEQYVNPQGKAFQPVQDTGAFATCP